MEKEALLVLNEILAKLNQNEKFIGGGACLAVIGWILGLVLTGWYGSSGAQATGLLVVAASIALIVVLYLKYAPNQNVTWPVTLPLLFLILAAVAGIFALLGLVQAFTYDPFGGLCNNQLVSNLCPSKPITLYVAVLVVLAGAAIAVYGAYLEWVAGGKPTK